MQAEATMMTVGTLMRRVRHVKQEAEGLPR
jgi:hypothetical protein